MGNPIGTAFQSISISYFNEFKYFTGLKDENLRDTFKVDELESINIPNNYTAIDNGSYTNVFTNASKLIHCGLPDNIKVLGYNVFSNCINLVMDSIPSTCTFKTMYGTFKNCPKIAIESVPASVEIMDSTFYGCTAITKFKVHGNVTTFGPAVFKDCANLETIEFDDSASEMTIPGAGGWHEGLFSNSKVTSVVFPSRLISIGAAAFADTNLISLVFKSETPCSIGSISLNSTCIIYVPDNSVEAYKVATGWTDYANRIKPMSEFIQ